MKTIFLLLCAIVACFNFGFGQDNKFSKEAVRAFVSLNKSLNKTNVSSRVNTALIMAGFEKLYAFDKIKAEHYYEHARSAHSTANIYFNYLQVLKNQLAARLGGWTDETKSSTFDDKNLEVSANFFLKEGHGIKIKDSLKQFVNAMQGCIDGRVTEVNIGIDTDEPSSKTGSQQKKWADNYWDSIPAIAAITELTKFQNDIRYAEEEVCNWNFKQVNAEEYHFDNVICVVNAENPTVVKGEKYKADIFLGAYNSTVTPEIEVNGQMLTTDKITDGVGLYETVATETGEQEIHVKIFVKDPRTGEKKVFATSITYQVLSKGSKIKK